MNFSNLHKWEVRNLFYENFVKQCEKSGKFPSIVVEELGFDKSTAAKWKKGVVPQIASRKKIADYFSISVEELMGTKKEPAGQGELEREWADIEVAYKSATPEARAAAKAAALAVLESSKKEG
jgi:transcriptional regulator with XRE-family HTH domain|nr:MAG TPA: repressor protein [Caudoviricetes sp.]